MMNTRHPSSPWQRQDWLIVFILFLFLSSLYYATASGITSSNDGSHYALIRTLVENRSFELKQFDDYAEGNDIAVTEDGRLFSDRPPGTALVGALFYLAGGPLEGLTQPMPSRHDANNPLLPYVLLLPAFAGAGTMAILYVLLRQLGIGPAAAVSAVLMVGLGTIHWKYSSVLFSHALSSLLVLLAYALALLLGNGAGTQRGLFLLLGLCLGAAVLVEYSNALLVVILCAYLLLSMRHSDRRQLLASFGALLFGGLLPALFLTIYNNTNFGSPLRLSYSYAINYPWAGSFTTTFNFPLADGLKGLLIGGEGDGWCGGPCGNTGLFVLSPLLFLAIPGWLPFYRQARRASLLAAIIFLVYLFLFARHRTFHGFTADGRYLAPFLPLLGLPLAFAVQWIIDLRSRPWLRTLLLALAFGLFLLSVRNQFLHIGTSYNYQLDPTLVNALFTSPDNIFTLSGQVFRNSANLAFLWFIEAILFLMLALAFVYLHKPVSRQKSGSG